VNEGGGTGGRARLPYVDVCGKTGSAQVASNDVMKGSSARNLKDNGWFEAFAPCHAPEIVVVAFWEHSEHGWLAAPITKDVLAAYFDKKKRLAEEAKEREKSLGAKMAALTNMVAPATPAARD
jgi:penicillin-binding protein 2